MSHGYIKPKKIAELGQTLLEEAILAVLADAHRNKEKLQNWEISERAGIHTCKKSYSNMTELITTGVLDKLQDRGAVRRFKYQTKSYWVLTP